MIERIGIVGGGQLGRMLTEAAHPLGFKVSVVDPVPNCPAAQVGADQIEAPLVDHDAIGSLAASCDVLTWEIEHIPADYLGGLALAGVNIEPSPDTLIVIQDKLQQKRHLNKNGIPVAPWSDYDVNKNVIESYLSGSSYVVKARRGGYDGRSNLVVDDLDDPRIEELFGGNPIYIEQKLNFDKELSVVAARDKKGNIVTYPVVETIHKDNICHEVLAPAEIDPSIATEANEIAHETLKTFQGAGIFAIEMFLVDEKVIVNEVAPRVHNSGHYTTEACVTSQFEQHIRAVTGLPLGSTTMRSPAAVMINILGTAEGTLNREGLDIVTSLDDTHPHFYGKDPRVARKVGHITVLGNTINEARAFAQAARKEFTI